MNAIYSAPRHPNILLVMADQWSAASFGCYHCDVADVTPNLDTFARDGIRFLRFYANAPVCGPSRATIFSGRSPVAHGVLHNNIEASRDTPFFTHALRQAGYATWGVGKFHFAPMQQYPPRELPSCGFDEVLISEDPKHGPWLDWIEREHPEFYEQALAVSWPLPYIENYPPHGENLRPAWRAAYEKHVAPLHKPPDRGIFHPSPLPAELHQTAWITDRAIATLQARASSEQPFFGFVSYVDPHDPYDPPQPYASRFPWQEMPPPVPQEWTRAWCPRDYARFQDTMFDLPSFDAETWARLRANFYGACRFVDDQIGRLLAALIGTGLDENTVVIFCTDHGDLIGDHGLLMKGPWHYDKTIRCPLMMRGPNVARGEVCDKLTCTLDIAPTLLKLAGIEADLEGRALPLTANATSGFTGWSEVVCETNASYVNPRGGCRTLVTDDAWRLTLFPGEDYGELFDLNSDPDEQQNLFMAAPQRSRRLHMAERLISAMSRQIYPLPRGQFAAL